ncbi:MAG TPA: DUF456 domain-containing protein [Anaeromyxobacter sp.]|nr:DUF456 domain-containing protein [Anaeromyxobacter sp.]
MHVLGYAFGFLALAAGVVGVVLPVVPGSLLLVAGTVVIAWADRFSRVGWGMVALSALVGAVVWAVDLAAAALGVRVARASRWAVIGACLGLFVGLFLGLPGILLGPAAGAIAFEYARDPNARRALRAGIGAFLGFVLGSAVKVALAMVLVGVIVLRLAK